MALPGAAAVKARVAIAALTVLAAIAVTGCGQDPPVPGEEEPKRALEPRTEALRFFPVDTEAVALVQTADPEALAGLATALGPSPTWSAQRARLRDGLTGGGVDPAEILALSREPGLDPELPPPEIAAGAVPGSGPTRERMLYVLPTDQGEGLDSAFKEAASDGDLEAAGEFDDALLYRSPGLAFAVRDGVLVAADSINRVQQALARRDGEREQQLDDAQVNLVLSNLPAEYPLHAYLADSDAAAAVSELLFGELPLDTEPSPQEITEIGLSAAAGANGAIEIDLVALLDLEPEVEPEPESGVPERPAVVKLTRAEIEDATCCPPAGGFLADLAAAAPVTGAVWIDGDQLRARLLLHPGR